MRMYSSPWHLCGLQAAEAEVVVVVVVVVLVVLVAGDWSVAALPAAPLALTPWTDAPPGHRWLAPPSPPAAPCCYSFPL